MEILSKDTPGSNHKVITKVMKKRESYYFRHDCNARRDPKMLALRLKHGWEGVGIYWAILEMLRESENYEYANNPEIIAFELQAEVEKITDIISNLGLFQLSDNSDFFYSERLKKDMSLIDEKADKARENGKKGGNPNFKKGKPNPYYNPIGNEIVKRKCERGEDNKDITDNISKRLPRDNQDINYKEDKEYILKESISKDIPKKVEVASAFSPLSETDNSLTVEEKPKREKASPTTPYEEIKTLWNKTDHSLPKVLVLSKARKSKMHLRFLEMGKDRDGGAMSVIETVFKKVSESPFLKGENGRGWKASFDWVFENGENWLKIYEGNYDERKGKGGTTRPNECRGRETDRGADDGSSKTEESYIEFAKRGFK